jgi:hypothetical protein
VPIGDRATQLAEVSQIFMGNNIPCFATRNVRAGKTKKHSMSIWIESWVQARNTVGRPDVFIYRSVHAGSEEWYLIGGTAEECD